MIANYYTLLHLVKRLAQSFSGRRIGEIFSQKRHELVISVESAGDDSEDAESGRSLLISCLPSLNYILPRQRVTRAKRNSIDIFPDAVHRTIGDIALHPDDRQIDVHLDRGRRIVIRLFGPSANVFYVDEADTILGSFLKPRLHEGSHLNDRPVSTAPHDGDLDKILKEGGLSPDDSIRGALKTVRPMFGSMLISEALFRAGIDPGSPVEKIPPASLHSLHESLTGLGEELAARPSPRVYTRTTGVPLFSLCELRHVASDSVELFETLEDGMAFYLREMRGQGTFLSRKQRLLSIIQQKQERTERALKKSLQSPRTSDTPSDFERKGKLILANLGQLTKGLLEITLEDYTSTGSEPLRITLDPSRSPAENAEWYFQKGKKAKAAAAGTKERGARLQKQNQILRTLSSEIESLTSLDQLRDFLTVHRRDFQEIDVHMPSERERKQERPPFRVFTVTGNFQVWVGKNSQNNDLLTMKYSTPNDLWFHVRGSGGSHVVLKVGTSKGEPGKEAIQETASIAAYFSKMKKAKVVPVAMTQKKYVRKPRGAPAGTVTIEREKVLFVEARLPEVPSQGVDKV